MQQIEELIFIHAPLERVWDMFIDLFQPTAKGAVIGLVPYSFVEIDLLLDKDRTTCMVTWRFASYPPTVQVQVTQRMSAPVDTQKYHALFEVRKQELLNLKAEVYAIDAQ